LKAGKSATAGKRRQTMSRVGTIEMIEDVINEEKYFELKTKLGTSLSRRVQYGALGIALAYLERSNKIEQNRDGSIVWIFMESEAARKSLRGSTEL
jgi:hypothetical protein